MSNDKSVGRAAAAAALLKAIPGLTADELAHACEMRANYIETGDATLSALDLSAPGFPKPHGVHIHGLSDGQKALVIRLRQVRAVLEGPGPTAREVLAAMAGPDFIVNFEVSVTANSPQQAAAYALTDLRDRAIGPWNAQVSARGIERTVQTAAVPAAPAQRPRG